MANTGKLLGIILAVVVIGGGIVLGIRASNDNKKTPTTGSQSQTNATDQTALAQNPASGTINIKNTMFAPSQITVAKGGTVTWTNNDTVTHTVVDDLSNVGGPNSGNIEPGNTYSFTFEKTGSFQYHCSIHSSMRGTIVVK